jgi:hypothetical protein
MGGTSFFGEREEGVSTDKSRGSEAAEVSSNGITAAV